MPVLYNIGKIPNCPKDLGDHICQRVNGAEKLGQWSVDVQCYRQ